MNADLSDAQTTEKTAVSDYEGLMAAKKKEVDALSSTIEQKLIRVGDLGAEIQEMKNDLGDTADGLADDAKFLEDSDNNCANKPKLSDEREVPYAGTRCTRRHKKCSTTMMILCSCMFWTIIMRSS